MASTTAQTPVRLAVLDSDTGFLAVLANRLDAAGWQHRVLASPVPIDALVSMRFNVLVVDLAVLGPAGWSYLEKVCERLPAPWRGGAAAPRRRARTSSRSRRASSRSAPTSSRPSRVTRASTSRAAS